MAEVEKYANGLIELVDLADQFKEKARELGGGKWGIRQVIDSYLSLFDRFCPFKIGDKVELVRDAKIQPGDGWYHSRHFLVKGAIGTIMARGYYQNGFAFQVSFDNETWIDSAGEQHSVEDHHWFLFSESALKKADD